MDDTVSYFIIFLMCFNAIPNEIYLDINIVQLSKIHLY